MRIDAPSSVEQIGSSSEQVDATVGQYLSPKVLEPILSAPLMKQMSIDPGFRAHIGMLLSHKECWWRMIQGERGITLVMQDDAMPCQNFAQSMHNLLTNLDDLEWDLMLLGFSCDQRTCASCELNEPNEKMRTGIIRVRYAVGVWGYLVRDHHVARKLHDQWPLDDYSFNQVPGLMVLGCVPPLISHSR